MLRLPVDLLEKPSIQFIGEIGSKKKQTRSEGMN